MITRKQLAGACFWKVTRKPIFNPAKSATPMGEHPEGLILYTSDGYMSAQLGSGGRNRFDSDDLYAGSSVEYTAGRPELHCL